VIVCVCVCVCVCVFVCVSVCYLRSATAELSLKADALKYVYPGIGWGREKDGGRERVGDKEILHRQTHT
jgi:hypothetical protein